MRSVSVRVGTQTPAILGLFGPVRASTRATAVRASARAAKSVRASARIVALAVIMAGCTAAPVAEPSPRLASVWLDVQVAPDDFAGSEVSMAVDPTDGLHVVAAAHAGGFGVYESFDGGRTWTAERLTAQSLFAATEGGPGIHLSLSDPAVAFSPDGTLHLAGLAFVPTSSVFVATRGDGGWVANTVWQSEVAATMNDKEWLGISPAGTLVVAWQREPAMDQLRGVEQAVAGLTGQRADLDAGLIVFSRSTDGGQSWSLPEQVSHGFHANGTQVAFAADGTGYMAWLDYERPHIDLIVSRDDGATWSDPVEVSGVDIVGSFPAFSRMHTLPGMAVGPTGAFIVWHDDRHGDADIMVAHSINGAQWQRLRVPDGPPGDGNVQFYPWVAVDGNGTAHITYYGARNGTADFAYRHVAWSPATGFTTPTDLSNQTFRIFSDASDEAASIGDYTAAAAMGDHVYAAWSDPRGERVLVHAAHRETAVLAR